MQDRNHLRRAPNRRVTSFQSGGGGGKGVCVCRGGGGGLAAEQCECKQLYNIVFFCQHGDDTRVTQKHDCQINITITVNIVLAYIQHINMEESSVICFSFSSFIPLWRGRE